MRPAGTFKTASYKLGATQVIPEEFETSIEIFARVLEEYGVAPDIIRREAETVRRAGYEVLRTQPWPSFNRQEYDFPPSDNQQSIADWPAVGIALAATFIRGIARR